jgi:hypothetical protein
MSRIQELPAALQPDLSVPRAKRRAAVSLPARLVELLAPLRSPPPPPRRWVGLSIAILTIGTIAMVALMVAGYLHHGWPAYYLQDHQPGTWLSAGCLALAGLVSLATARRCLQRAGRRFWILAAATLFLATADDLFRLHEHLDLAIHAYFHADPKHPVTSHIDNVVIACYGIVALYYVRRRKEQILHLPWTAYALGIAFVLFVAMMILDFADRMMSLEDTFKTYSIFFILIGCLAAYMSHKSAGDPG